MNFDKCMQSCNNQAQLGHEIFSSPQEDPSHSSVINSQLNSYLQTLTTLSSAPVALPILE